VFGGELCVWCEERAPAMFDLCFRKGQDAEIAQFCCKAVGDGVELCFSVMSCVGRADELDDDCVTCFEPPYDLSC